MMFTGVCLGKLSRGGQKLTVKSLEGASRLVPTPHTVFTSSKTNEALVYVQVSIHYNCLLGSPNPSL